jgi:predicted secreted protein
MVAATTVAAVPANAAPAAKKDVVLNVSMLPGQVRLLAGESVRITLSTNVTTGYSWSTMVTGDAKAVAVSKGRYAAPSTELVGAPGMTSWVVTATGNGVAKVKILTTPPGGGTAKKVGVLAVYAGTAVTQK